MMKNGYFLAGLLVLSGCSVTGMGTDKFKCGTHEDPRCASVFEAYENTHGDWKGSKTGKPQERQPGASLPASMPIMNAAVDETTWPKPVLEPARVIRVWIAPWVDENETLHWPSYVFAEVTPRKWSYGKPDFRGVKQLVPVQTAPRATQTENADSPKEKAN